MVVKMPKKQFKKIRFLLNRVLWAQHAKSPLPALLPWALG